jgi:thioredoxin reductase
MTHANLTVYGAPWCGDCKRAKKFLPSKTLETSLAGVFAAGDVRQGSTKQAASAAGEGATAALMLREYLKTI